MNTSRVIVEMKEIKRLQCGACGSRVRPEAYGCLFELAGSGAASRRWCSACSSFRVGSRIRISEALEQTQCAPALLTLLLARPPTDVYLIYTPMMLGLIGGFVRLPRLLQRCRKQFGEQLWRSTNRPMSHEVPHLFGSVLIALWRSQPMS